MTTDDYRRALVALACLVEPGNRELWLLVEKHGAIEALAIVRRRDVAPELRDTSAPRLEENDPLATADTAIERIKQVNGRVIVPGDDEWPAQLEDLRRVGGGSDRREDRDTYPPLCLWLRGPLRLEEVAAKSVAVVGSRASTPYGNYVATEFGYGLSQRGWAVISGGAFGIDGQAHRGALAAAGSTVAVLACGVDRPYPSGHANLFEHIAHDGLLLSEWPPGAAPHRHRFLIRNRVIAALTRGTVVVEASARSGARQTAHRSQQMGRPTMAVPGPITSAMSVGAHQMLRTLNTRLVTSAAEIVEEVGRIGDDLAPIERGPDRELDRLDAKDARVLDGVPARGGAGPAQIASASGVALRDVLQALPLLKMKDFVVENDGLWRVAPRRLTGK